MSNIHFFTKRILIFTLLIGTFESIGQVAKSPAVSSKTLVAKYFKAGQWGEWSGILFQNTDKSEVRFLNKDKTGKFISEFWSAEVTGSDPEDESAELHNVSANIGKTYKLIYTTKQVKYKGYDSEGGSSSNENVIIGFQVIEGESVDAKIEVDDFKGATCKVFQKGVLMAIAEQGKLYRIYKNKKSDEKIIQNKNELCRASECARVTIDKEGIIGTFQLPNTTDRNLRGKIEGEQILKWEKHYGYEDNYYDKKITFKGDKQQAAMAVLIYAWFQ